MQPAKPSIKSFKSFRDIFILELNCKQHIFSTGFLGCIKDLSLILYYLVSVALIR